MAMAVAVAAAWLPPPPAHRNRLASPRSPFAAPISVHLPRRAPPPGLRSSPIAPQKSRHVVASAQFDFSRVTVTALGSQVKGHLDDKPDNPRLITIPPFPLLRMHCYSSLSAIRTAWRVGNDVVEAGTNLVPDPVPRPIARIGVVFAAAAVALFFLKSIASTAFFVLTMMGVIYLGFLAMNPKEVSGSRVDEATGDPSEDPVKEAERIMEKYK
ncbi:hypothetical protein U9M48_014854 [Paspalum notatum var. saurae]|uniref:Uncharacterized protein n=1 Tax=Paspalum notatum var. saurae TaxID=547442 RepID=A0AAQ3WKX2_PASNO